MAPSRNTATGWRLAAALLVAATLASGSVVTPAGLPVNSLQQPPMPPTQAPNVAVLERAVPGGSGFIPITPSPAVPVVAPDAAPPSSRDGRQLSMAAPETGNWRLVGKLLMDCSRSGDLIGCLKVKAVATLGRALASDAPIPIMEDLALARDPEAEVATPGSDAVQSESELEATLPRSMEERSGRLDKLLLDRLDAFIRSRTVQFSVPLGMGLFEGRGKKDKKGGYAMMLVAAMAGMYMQMAMGGMAMMSGKALIVAKIALALAAVCLLKKSGGGGGGDHSQGAGRAV